MAVGRALDEAGAAIRDAARADLIDLFTDRHVEGEGVMMAAKAWLVSAIA
jgi:hypothetical protein